MIGYSFKNKELLTTALTHSSYGNEVYKDKLHNNERLEFLGDAVLELTVSDYLFNEESKLFIRLKYGSKKTDNKNSGDRDETLFFLKDFNVPSTNNVVESSQRGVKIKQKSENSEAT